MEADRQLDGTGSHHPNLVNYVESFLLGESRLWVIMELFDGGPLNELIDGNPGMISERHIARITRDVCQGIGYLHSKNILHRCASALLCLECTRSSPTHGPEY